MNEMKVMIERDDRVAFIVFKYSGASPKTLAELVYERYLTDEGKKAMKGLTVGQGRCPGVSLRIINAEHLTPAAANQMAQWLVIEKIPGTTFPVIGNAAIIHALDKDAAIKIYCERREAHSDLVSAYNTKMEEDFYFYLL